MSSIAMAGYPQARSWLVNAGIDPSPYDNSEPIMLDRLVDLLQEKKWYPDEISINPFDDPISLNKRADISTHSRRCAQFEEDWPAGE
jgi:hypothetical protein